MVKSLNEVNKTKTSIDSPEKVREREIEHYTSSRIQKSGHKKQDTKSRTQNAGHKKQDTKSNTQKVGHKVKPIPCRDSDESKERL